MERDRSNYSKVIEKSGVEKPRVIPFPELWKKYVNEKKEDIVIKGPNPSQWEY